jgi:hypothetical protein
MIIKITPTKGDFIFSFKNKEKFKNENKLNIL